MAKRSVGRSATPSDGSEGQPPRLFAVIPAAGHSRRMGQPKLLLPVGEATVIARLLGALEHPAIAARVVVMRSDDEPLRREAAACGATVVQPEQPPPDMRTSVEHALSVIGEQYAPRPDDGWLLVPADHPVLARDLVDRLVREWFGRRPEVLVPTCGGRRGHPTFFRWTLAAEVPGLPNGAGLNRLVRDTQREVVEIEVGDPDVLVDLDTPADYEALAARWGGA